MSTGVGITLVTAGAILRFAVPATFIHGLNVHVVGVIVMLAGTGVSTRTSRQREARRRRDRHHQRPEPATN
jgi:hypothetical protein